MNKTGIVMAALKDEMSTQVSVLNKLSDEGYTAQFKASSEGLQSLSTQKTYKPADVEIKHFYRFEGESSTDDSSIVYAIETSSGEKGTLVDSYGMYGDPLVAKFIQEVEAITK